MTRLSRAATSGGLRRDMTLWPFTPTSPWNIPIGSGATFQTAGQQPTADLLDTAYDRALSSLQWSHPIYWATTSDPLVTVTEDGGRTAQYRIPASATPALPDITVVGDTATDSHLHVVQPDGQTLREAWLFEWTSSTTATCGYMATIDLTSDGLADGVRGYGGSAIGGLLRPHEVANRYIPHAIALATYYEYMLLDGFVWPAQREDSSAPANYHGNIGMGTFAAIPPAVDLAGLGLNADGLALATALQDYGLYVVDSAETWTVYAQPGADETRLDAMWADMPAIRAQVRVVTNNSEANPGGPGTRRRSYAPRLVLPGGSGDATGAGALAGRPGAPTGALAGTVTTTGALAAATAKPSGALTGTVAGGSAAFRALSSAAAYPSTSFTVNAPTGTATGDQLVAIQVGDDLTTLASMTASGWTLDNSYSVAGWGFLKVWKRSVTGSPPANFMFGGNAAGGQIVAILAFSGASSTLAVSTAFNDVPTASTSHVLPAAAAASGNVQVSAVFTDWKGVGAAVSWVVASSGMTEQLDTNDTYMSLWVGTQNGVTSGTKTITASRSIDYVALSLAVAAA